MDRFIIDLISSALVFILAIHVVSVMVGIYAEAGSRFIEEDNIAVKIILGLGLVVMAFMIVFVALVLIGLAIVLLPL